MNEMTLEDIEARVSQIAVEAETADEATLDALTEERNSLEERKNAILREIEERKQTIEEVKKLDGEKINIEENRKTMTIEEVRNSKEYIDAYAKYVRTGRDDEIRALLSTNATVATGYVPVPAIVEDRIRTAWSKLGLMDLVGKSYIRGNLKVGFELSASDAVVHAEGADAVSAETLTIGTVTLIPASLKKFVELSDESIDLSSEEFLMYVYDEITYRIAKLAQKELLAKITSASTTATSTAVSVAEVDDGAPSLSIVSECIGKLSDEASNPVIVMNKETWSQFKAIQYSAGFAIDPFEGLPVHFDNTIPAYSSTATTGTWLIVGDFGRGALANFPNGDEISLKYDDVSQAPRDIVRIIGREFVGLGLVADKAFCRVTMHT